MRLWAGCYFGSPRACCTPAHAVSDELATMHAPVACKPLISGASADCAPKPVCTSRHVISPILPAPRPRSGNPGRTFMKLIVAADSDVVVGCHMVRAGPHALLLAPRAPSRQPQRPAVGTWHASAGSTRMPPSAAPAKGSVLVCQAATVTTPRPLVPYRAWPARAYAHLCPALPAPTPRRCRWAPTLPRSCRAWAWQSRWGSPSGSWTAPSASTPLVRLAAATARRRLPGSTPLTGVLSWPPAQGAAPTLLQPCSRPLVPCPLPQPLAACPPATPCCAAAAEEFVTMRSPTRQLRKEEAKVAA